MPHPLLYASADKRLIVLDVPASIAWAQGVDSRHLLSVPAVQEPYCTPEPRGAKRALLQEKIPHWDRQYSAGIEASLHIALEQVRPHLADRDWCLTRRCWDHVPSSRTAGSSNGNEQGAGAPPPPPLILSAGRNRVDVCELGHPLVVHNPHDTGSDIDLADHGRVHVPPTATFINASIAAGLPAFQEATCVLARVPQVSSVARITFDLILLDPPWSNRSVRNSRSYRSADDQDEDPFVQVLPVLEQYLGRNGVVAVWITNKPRIRRQVIDAFQHLRLTLVEEVVWLKITAQGQPVSPLDGLWRKPYEILLLFTAHSGHETVARRFLFAVPDVHSRKPNLKVLFDALLRPGYRALEVFARSLTAGWWAWGDEVVKFQHENHWAEGHKTSAGSSCSQARDG